MIVHTMKILPREGARRPFRFTITFLHFLPKLILICSIKFLSTYRCRSTVCFFANIYTVQNSNDLKQSHDSNRKPFHNFQKRVDFTRSSLEFCLYFEKLIGKRVFSLSKFLLFDGNYNYNYTLTFNEE